MAPNISRLCETKWSEKYKSIRKFSDNFTEFVKALEKLSVDGNYVTRKHAYQLHPAALKPVFLVAMVTIAKYSLLLEPVANILQAQTIDFIGVAVHIGQIIEVLSQNREDSSAITEEILKNTETIATELDVELSVPRRALKQKNRSNPPANDINEYWRRSLIIPYIDSISSSLRTRFSQENTPAFAVSKLHPLFMLKISSFDNLENAKLFDKFYDVEDIQGELNLWYNIWSKKDLPETELKEIEVIDLLEEANEFFPAMRKALKILCTFPCTTATVERSFSTLRRVKTWLRSTMGEERHTGLCLMSVHRNFVKENHERIEKKY